MTTPERVPDPFLCAEDDAVAEAIRIANARCDKVTRDTCDVCGGEGCACTDDSFEAWASLKGQQRLR